MKITFLGGGNMAAALIGGMVERGFAAGGIQVVELGAEARARLVERFGVRAVASADAAALGCEVLVLAVKPQQMKAALAPLAGRLGGQLVISIAAGLRLADLGRWLGAPGRPYSRLVRCMPNTPALIGAGVTGLYADPSVDAGGREAAERVLAAVGSTVWAATEEQMDAVTAISGSGPAYVFHFIEALEAAGRALGFDEAGARKLAIETVLGAARLAAGSEDSPAVLREKVTSKGGTTAAALASLAASGWHDALIAAVRAAQARGRELGAELGKD
ncbi:pyrroline-5-carboxylate reductase [Thauera linaloolentis]|uniref:Pyrroline-5-carboxylate reductase n=1 Tax=Thauera linaloolentis (strain DSM 12138 / JCM 21573 / CCUG 41526 / CIP 105981 / IAM 15112 / NBRC 102519 / 47Lol) TaxID=1123367 RepID=N6Y5F1_THAL4|nr:pyrroline-5-carboxylate reductase [Thauera linaloolentis]ENO89396.1 pyrroline-5-carboxylate reductase [Thauera linaloolentis 47Lol = DSM 12138]MCM8564380.1 pyrroline-5-carboxylate reductase [Thauera linaloolentis]